MVRIIWKSLYHYVGHTQYVVISDLKKLFQISQVSIYFRNVILSIINNVKFSIKYQHL
jgi:hypothetical protein